MVPLRGLSERVCAGTLRRILVYSGAHNNETQREVDIMTGRTKETNGADLGTVIRATHRLQDLIPVFLIEARIRDRSRAEEIAKSVPHNDLFFDDGLTLNEEHAWWDSDDAHETCIELFDLLDECAPPYCYFGAHEGDGSDFGYWISWDSIEDSHHDGTLLKVADLSEIPDDYSGDVCLINDHGNVTMGFAVNGEFTSTWSVV